MAIVRAICQGTYLSAWQLQPAIARTKLLVRLVCVGRLDYVQPLNLDIRICLSRIKRILVDLIGILIISCVAFGEAREMFMYLWIVILYESLHDTPFHVEVFD